MKIAVNTRLLIKDKLAGIGRFSYESLKEICTQHPEHQFFFIFDRKWSDDFIFSKNITPISLAPTARHPLLYYLWFEHRIPQLLKKIKPDLFLSPDGYLSLKTDIRSINVIHDLNFVHYPQDIPSAERFFFRHFFSKYAHKATRIATVSEYSKQDIANTYSVNPDKIDVVYNGASSAYKPVSESVKQSTILKYSAGKPYFIYVGALQPRKNLVNLFKAYDIFSKQCNEQINLLIVGEKMWWTKAIATAYNEMVFKDNVIFTGRLDTHELNKVLGSALALTYVSYFEGFGIPIVEALYSDTPVITSNVTSMPEVAGDAALLINPFSPNSIAEAMLKITSDKKLCSELIRKGRLQRENFSWQKTANKLWETIERAML